MKLYHLLFLILTIVSSCTNNDNKKKSNDSVEFSTNRNLLIRDYAKKFHSIDLPFVFWSAASIDKGKLFKLDKNSNDTLFFTGDNDEIIYGYGLLSDTTHFYSFLYFGQSDEIYPILVNYSKAGQLIDKATLIVNGCGSDCGLTYCSYSALIGQDFSIYIGDTAKYDGVCDNSGDYLPDSDSTFINSKLGRFDKTGRIKFSAVKRHALKNSP